MSLAIGRVEAVFAGPVKSYAGPGRADGGPREWTSGIAKSPIDGPVFVGVEGLTGDAQADLAVHGGPDGAILAYAASHYPTWSREIGRDLPFGSFGENLTVTGFDDSTVHLGDVWAVGEGDDCLLIEVTQPRQPCYKLARRLDEPRIVKWVTERCNGGWYFRVLRPGAIATRMAVRKISAGDEAWPVAEAVRVMYARGREPEAARRLGAVKALSGRWKQALTDA